MPAFGFLQEVKNLLSKLFGREISAKDVLVNIPEIIAGIALIVAVGATGINVFTRYVLKFTYFWYTDITVLAFFWLTFMSCAAAYRRKMHYGIDVIYNKLGIKGKAIFMVCVRLVILVILALVFYCIFLLVVNLRGKWLPTMRWSYIYCYIPMVLGFIHMTVYSLVFLVQDIIALKNTSAEKKEVK